MPSLLQYYSVLQQPFQSASRLDGSSIRKVQWWWKIIWSQERIDKFLPWKVKHLVMFEMTCAGGAGWRSERTSVQHVHGYVVVQYRNPGIFCKILECRILWVLRNFCLSFLVWTHAFNTLLECASARKQLISCHLKSTQYHCIIIHGRIHNDFRISPKRCNLALPSRIFFLLVIHIGSSFCFRAVFFCVFDHSGLFDNIVMTGNTRNATSCLWAPIVLWSFLIQISNHIYPKHTWNASGHSFNTWRFFLDPFLVLFPTGRAER